MTEYVVVKQPKSVGIALLLTFLFGPVGLFYSTVFGAFFMIFVGIVYLFLAFAAPFMITMFDASDFLTYYVYMPIGYWILCIIWAYSGVIGYNNELRSNSKTLQGLQSYPASPSQPISISSSSIPNNNESQKIITPTDWLKHNQGKTLNEYYAKHRYGR